MRYEFISKLLKSLTVLHTFSKAGSAVISLCVLSGAMHVHAQFKRTIESIVAGFTFLGILSIMLQTESMSTFCSDFQAAISWRASGNRQISLNASAERAFANFRDKKHRILQLQIFATKTSCASIGSPALAL